jgi:hypothetical protein
MLTLSRCFYLNPIVSAAALAPVLFFWKGKFLPPSKDDTPTAREVFAKLDYHGIVVFTAAVVALLLGLQFGGLTYKWSDRRTVASLVVAGVLFIVFSAIEWWKGDNAILPGKIIGSRVVCLASIYTATLDGAYFILTYQVRILSCWIKPI